MAETLVCESCNNKWKRERKRGRKPRQCPDCSAGPPGNSPGKRKKAGGTEGTPRTPEASQERETTIIKDNTRPFTQRPSGWCTDYDPMPKAQHWRCDGDLGKYICPCWCHKE